MTGFLSQMKFYCFICKNYSNFRIFSIFCQYFQVFFFFFFDFLNSRNFSLNCKILSLLRDPCLVATLLNELIINNCIKFEFFDK